MGTRMMTTQRGENKEGRLRCGGNTVGGGPHTSFESGKLQHTSGTPAFVSRVFREHCQAHSFVHCHSGSDTTKAGLISCIRA